MNELDLAWAAGIIDGEGSISANCRPRQSGPKKGLYTWAIFVKATNTDPRMARRLQRIFGFGFLTHRTPKRPRERPTFGWEVAARKAVAVLEAARPYLVLKQEQADVALALAATMHLKGGALTYTGSKGTRKLLPEILERRIELATQLKVLKRNLPTEEAM